MTAKREAFRQAKQSHRTARRAADPWTHLHRVLTHAQATDTLNADGNLRDARTYLAKNEPYVTLAIGHRAADLELRTAILTHQLDEAREALRHPIRHAIRKGLERVGHTGAVIGASIAGLFISGKATAQDEQKQERPNAFPSIVQYHDPEASMLDARYALRFLYGRPFGDFDEGDRIIGAGKFALGDDPFTLALEADIEDEDVHPFATPSIPYAIDPDIGNTIRKVEEHSIDRSFFAGKASYKGFTGSASVSTLEKLSLIDVTGELNPNPSTHQTQDNFIENVLEMDARSGGLSYLSPDNRWQAGVFFYGLDQSLTLTSRVYDRLADDTQVPPVILFENTVANVTELELKRSGFLASGAYVFSLVDPDDFVLGLDLGSEKYELSKIVNGATVVDDAFTSINVTARARWRAASLDVGYRSRSIDWQDPLTPEEGSGVVTARAAYLLWLSDGFALEGVAGRDANGEPVFGGGLWVVQHGQQRRIQDFTRHLEDRTIPFIDPAAGVLALNNRLYGLPDGFGAGFERRILPGTDGEEETYTAFLYRKSGGFGGALSGTKDSDTKAWQVDGILSARIYGPVWLFGGGGVSDASRQDLQKDVRKHALAGLGISF